MNTQEKLADAIAAGSVPVNVALWLVDLEFYLRVAVSLGSLILIGFAIWAKFKQAWRS